MDFEVRRDDLRQLRFVEAGTPELDDGQALLRISTFALTANNVTYAVFGDAMSYWRFFPAGDGWGRVPVWGFADVELSRAEGLAPGERVFGYLPMSTRVVVTPARLADGGFVDGAPHRSNLPPVYNQYQRVAADPGYDPAMEHEQAILRPLFTTSFLIDDWLAGEGVFGARSVVIASASSKTALALAFLLSSNDRAEVIGLTSARNAGFVEGVGYYDRTVVYSEVGDLGRDTPTVLVDMAGDGGVLAAVHAHFGDALQHSCLVGATHWEEAAPPVDLPGPTPSFFFAPDQVQKRRAEWGPGGLESHVTEAWQSFLSSVDAWLTITEHRGDQAVADTWLDVLEGRTQPDVGHVLSLGG